MSKALDKGFEQKKAEFQSLKDVENALSDFTKNGITEFVLHERLQDKGRLVHFLNSVQKNCPELFLTVPVSVSVLDREIAELCSNLFCTLDIQLAGTSKPTKDGTVYLFDKKKYAGKVSMLNDMGLVFGFDMDWAVLHCFVTALILHFRCIPIILIFLSWKILNFLQSLRQLFLLRICAMCVILRLPAKLFIPVAVQFHGFFLF